MCKADLEFLIEFLRDHLNEERPLDEWKTLFNNLLTSRQRLTLNEMAFAIRVLKYRNMVEVNKVNHSYLFQSVQPAQISTAPVVLAQNY
jgi:hypothetical protein